MTGRQIAIVLALTLIMPLLCGALPACSSSMGTISNLSTFVAGGMIGIIQQQAKANAAAT